MWEEIDRLEQSARPYLPFSALNTVLRLLDRNARSLLDVGCGKGKPAQSIRRNRKLSTVGADVFLPYLKDAKAACSHDDYVQSDIRYLPFRPKSFDVALGMEVLEHLSKEEGLALLKSMEQIARHQVIITTPVGRHAQEPYDDNPYQEHKHIWRPEELRQLGYRVKGHGVRNIGGVSGIQSPLPKLLRPLMNVLWVIAGPVTYFMPTLAGNMVCVKKMRCPCQARSRM